MSVENRESWQNFFLYKAFTLSVTVPIFHIYFRGRIHGANKVPQSQPIIVVSNHASYFDPPIISYALGRPVAYMAKEELFSVPILKQFIVTYGAYPVNRDSNDIGAIRQAMGRLKEGWATGIFLEGTRTSDGRIHNPKLGAVSIAAKMNIPLLPVCLWGTEKVFSKDSSIPKPVPITVRIGDLISPPTSRNKEDLEMVTSKCADIINSLHDLGR